MTSSVDTTTLRALLATIISQPDEDTPRLQYADVLMDSDDVLDRALGEYIKLSIELCNHKKLVKPRIDTSLTHIDFTARYDGYVGVDSYDWYRKGIELRERANHLWKTVQFMDVFVDYSLINQVEFEVTRGFISSITCTASQFLSICDKLIWHESMMDECRNCQGYGNLLGCAGDKYNPECTFCDAKGKVSRNCPLTAHPVREIEITTDIDRKFPQFKREYGQGYWTTDKWPNIQFNLGDNRYGTYVDVEIEYRQGIRTKFEAMEPIKFGDLIMASATGRAAKWDSSFQVPSVGTAMANSYDLTFNE